MNRYAITYWSLLSLIVLLWVFCYVDARRYPTMVSAPVPVALPIITFPTVAAPALPSISSGHLLLASQLSDRLPSVLSHSLLTESGVYTEVSSSWIAPFLAHYTAVLTSESLPHWTTSYDCLHRARQFRLMAQQQYAHESESRLMAADSVAILEVSYVRGTDIADAKAHGWDGRMDSGGAPTGHVILAVVTERGVILVDPSMEMPTVVTLTDQELDTVFLTLG